MVPNNSQLYINAEAFAKLKSFKTLRFGWAQALFINSILSIINIIDTIDKIKICSKFVSSL